MAATFLKLAPLFAEEDYPFLSQNIVYVGDTGKTVRLTTPVHRISIRRSPSCPIPVDCGIASSNTATSTFAGPQT